MERWDGDAVRPDLYLRLHLCGAPAFLATDDETTLTADLDVHHPRLHAEGGVSRTDGRGRYSPSLRQVFVARHCLHVCIGKDELRWPVRASRVAEDIAALAEAIQTSLVPVVERLSDPRCEVLREDARGGLTAEDIRRRRRVPPDAQAGLIWTTQDRPALFAGRLMRPEDPAVWRDSVVSAILHRSWSLRYTAAHAELMGLAEDARRFSDLADALERDSGVALVPDRGVA